MSFSPMINYQASDAFFQELTNYASSLIENETNLVANLANISSLIFYSIPNLNWCGFYLWNEPDQELVLGPFQGKPACIRIKENRGVCGTAFAQKKLINVPDVNSFPGHIACDSASLSELVIPLFKNSQCLGVLDLDSPIKNNFSSVDEIGMKFFTEIIIPKIFINF
jgi:L-methionine (R)-S-oxide reductase